MGGNETEACGRCGMSSVVDAACDGEDAADPFGDARIEVDERELRAVSPAAWLAGVRARIDAVATELTYGRR
jgi:hypothetical protein